MSRLLAKSVLGVALAALSAGCPLTGLPIGGTTTGTIGGGGGGGTVSLSPPSWLLGTWKDGNATVTLDVTSSDVSQSGQKMSQLADSQDSGSDTYTIRLKGGGSLKVTRISDKEIDYSISSSSAGTLRMFKDGKPPVAPPSWIQGTWSDSFGLTSWTFTASTAKGPGGDVTSMFRSQASSSTKYTLKWGASGLESEATFEQKSDGRCLSVSTKMTSGGSATTDTLCKK